MPHIEVVRGGALTKGASTKGIERGKAFETNDVLFSTSKIASGNVSDWHHHGERDLFGYIISGTLRFDYGKDGKESVQASRGDFFHIPVGLVHRDVNPEGSDAVVLAVLIGGGPALVNLDGPKASG